ncbi:MAG: hypothetical protein ACRC12_02145, partial [Holosporales bacterium]
PKQKEHLDAFIKSLPVPGANWLYPELILTVGIIQERDPGFFEKITGIFQGSKLFQEFFGSSTKV